MSGLIEKFNQKLDQTISLNKSSHNNFLNNIFLYNFIQFNKLRNINFAFIICLMYNLKFFQCFFFIVNIVKFKIKFFFDFEL